MPLDAKRFLWSPRFPLPVSAPRGALLAGSFFLIFRSYTDNTYLSPLVRVQTDRKQQVISTAVYRFVRHRCTLAGILMFVGAPVLIGSLWDLGAGLALSVLLMARITDEETMLEREPDGYRDSMKNVRYRLFPYLWQDPAGQIRTGAGNPSQD